MTEDDALSDEYVTQLRAAVESAAADESDWTAFHSRINEGVAAQLSTLRRRASGGYRATAAVGGAWWDYAARAGLAAVPIALAAALLLVAYLRSDSSNVSEPIAVASSTSAVSRNPDATRAAFESVLTGTAAPQAVITKLIPVPSAAFLADSSGGGSR